jgi:hypothetical protein
MRIPIARCAHCHGLFELGQNENHCCPDCYPGFVLKEGETTPWKHIGWMDEGNLFVWQEDQLT